MKNSTALGANSETTRTITFKSAAHKNFYLEYLSQYRYKDVYHKALHIRYKRYIINYMKYLISEYSCIKKPLFRIQDSTFDWVG
ncbi:MAG: DUF6075 family protein [Oliverpabstia sp.]|nr:DUF6075 family protein [Oliverpabstia sp.]